MDNHSGFAGMELCTLYQFDSEKSVIFNNVDITAGYDELSKAFDILGKVTRFQRIDEHIPNSVLCQFEDRESVTLLDTDYVDKQSGKCWTVIKIQEKPDMSGLDVNSEVDTDQLLDDIIHNMVEDFQDQITKLATAHEEDAEQMNQKAFATFASLNPVHGGFMTSTPHPKVTFNLNESKSANKQPISCTVDSIPQDVQRVIVEHIVKQQNGAVRSTHLSHKLSTFSGVVPKPSGEGNFDTWKLQAKQVLTDTDLSENEKRRKILDSLLPPALNTALYVGDRATAQAHFLELEKAYGSVASGEELYIQFVEMHQNSGEKCSDYLNRLHTHLQKVVERKGFTVGKPEEHLLKQFLRGCWDETLITQLRLKDYASEKHMQQLTFSQVLVMIRSFEEERDTKDNRRKRHLGMTSSRVVSNMHSASDQFISTSLDSTSVTNPTVKLQEKVEQLEKELSWLKTRSNNTEARATAYSHRQGDSAEAKRRLANNTAKQTMRFCYQCGEDDHYLRQCSNPVNAELVQQKLCKRQKNKVHQARTAITPASEDLNM